MATKNKDHKKSITERIVHTESCTRETQNCAYINIFKVNFRDNVFWGNDSAAFGGIPFRAILYFTGYYSFFNAIPTSSIQNQVFMV